MVGVCSSASISIFQVSFIPHFRQTGLLFSRLLAGRDLLLIGGSAMAEPGGGGLGIQGSATFSFRPTMKERGLLRSSVYTLHFNLLNGAASDGRGRRGHTDRRRAAQRGGFSLVLSGRTCASLSFSSTRASVEAAAAGEALVQLQRNLPYYPASSLRDPWAHERVTID